MRGLKKPELLAPAGSFAHFLAAAENGADGVYFGGKAFNARQTADNFTEEEIKDAVAYASVRDIKTYMTVNTLMEDREFSKAVNQVEEGLKAGVDGFILQDLGLASFLKDRYPEIRMHLSTQGTVYNKEGALFARQMGFQRVVLARELSEEQIREITETEAIETEVFVHGALCVCYSGQCMMSRMIGMRSGNRGSCAQPCRLPYFLEKESPGKEKAAPAFPGNREGREKWRYLLSPRDICLAEELDRLILLGVDSLKIEGRLKTPEYTAAVTGIYRRYLDLAYERAKQGAAAQKAPLTEKDRDTLLQVFNRGGFTKGYFCKTYNGGLLSGKSPKHQGLFLGCVKSVIPSGKQKDKFLAEITAERTVATGDGVEILSEQRPGGVITYIKGKKGIQKTASPGETVRIGDLPGPIRKGDPVYKISDCELTEALRKTYEGKSRRKIPVRGKFTAGVNEPMRLALWDDSGTFIEAESEEKLQKVQKGGFALSEDRIFQQLQKTGNSPFCLLDCEIQMQQDVFFTVAQLNRLRRIGLEALEARKKDIARRKHGSVFLPMEK